MRGLKTIRSLRAIATDLPSFRTYAAAFTNSHRAAHPRSTSRFAELEQHL
jgi:hypothetical protein